MWTSPLFAYLVGGTFVIAALRTRERQGAPALLPWSDIPNISAGRPRPSHSGQKGSDPFWPLLARTPFGRPHTTSIWLRANDPVRPHAPPGMQVCLFAPLPRQPHAASLRSALILGRWVR